MFHNLKMEYFITENFLFKKRACHQAIECLRQLHPEYWNPSIRLTPNNCKRFLVLWNKSRSWFQLTNWLDWLVRTHGISSKLTKYLNCTYLGLENKLDCLEEHRRVQCLYQILYQVMEKINK
jgi:hypothetical protein